MVGHAGGQKNAMLAERRNSRASRSLPRKIETGDIRIKRQRFSEEKVGHCEEGGWELAREKQRGKERVEGKLYDLRLRIQDCERGDLGQATNSCKG